MKKGLMIAAVGVLSLTVTGVAFAETPTVRAKAQEKVAAVKETKVKNCDAVGIRVKNQITKFEENKEKHITSYNQIKEKIQKFITKLDGKGYDTSKLKVDLVNLDAKIKKFANDYATYISLLQETKQYTCGKSEGEFKAKLQAARDQLKVVHDDTVDIRTFYAKTVRSDILEIKNQKPAADTQTEKTDNTEVNND